MEVRCGHGTVWGKAFKYIGNGDVLMKRRRIREEKNGQNWKVFVWLQSAPRCYGHI